MTGLHGSLAPLPQDGACRGATGGEPASLSLHSRLAGQASDFPPAIARGHSHSDQRLTSCPRTSPPPSAGLPSSLFPSSLHSYIPHPFLAPRFSASPPIPPSVFFLTFQSQRLTAAAAAGFRKPALCSAFALLDALQSRKVRARQEACGQPESSQKDNSDPQALSHLLQAPNKVLFYLFYLFCFHRSFFFFSSVIYSLLFLYFPPLGFTSSSFFFSFLTAEDVFQGVIAFHWAKIRYSLHKCH